MFVCTQRARVSRVPSRRPLCSFAYKDFRSALGRSAARRPLRRARLPRLRWACPPDMRGLINPLGQRDRRVLHRNQTIHLWAGGRWPERVLALESVLTAGTAVVLRR